MQSKQSAGSAKTKSYKKLQNLKNLTKMGQNVEMQNAGTFLATPKGKFNWLGLVIELVKAAIVWVTANQIG